MDGEACHDAEPDAKGAARELVLKRLGVKRVAAWCGVAEDTVYQWLKRGTPAEPVPASRVPAILTGAQAEGFDAPLAILWPAMAKSAEPTP
jgi:hypothetical protein